MELNKVLTAEETAKEIMRQHYIENYKAFASYDMNNARNNALITVKFLFKQHILTHKKLIANGIGKGAVEDTTTYKFLEEVKQYITTFEAIEL